MTAKQAFKRLLFATTLASALTFHVSANALVCEPISPHFGWILNEPITSLVFWPNPIPAWQFIAVEWTAALQDPAFYTRVAEYGVQQGSPGQIYTPTNVPTGATLTETQIQNGLVTMLESAHRVPQSGEMFLIFLPSGTVNDVDASPSVGGHHGWFNHTFSNGATLPVVYGIVKYNNDIQHLYVAASHEVYEAFTDPIWIPNGSSFFGFGYWDDQVDTATLQGKSPELGDLCVTLMNPVPAIWQNKYGMDLSLVYSQFWCACL